MAYDLIIKNGKVIDGSGLPGFHGDVAVSGGRIVEIGKVSGEARQVLNADGLVVAPGIIDNHTHYDAQVTWDPLCTYSCYHGITTVVMGNCSLAMAPAHREDREMLAGVLSHVEAIPLEAIQAGVNWSWETIPEYLNALDRRLGINVASLIGHSAVRRYVMGEASQERHATDEEVTAMKAIVREGLAAGAVGISFERNLRHFDWNGRLAPTNLASESDPAARGATAPSCLSLRVTRAVPHGFRGFISHALPRYGLGGEVNVFLVRVVAAVDHHRRVAVGDARLDQVDRVAVVAVDGDRQFRVLGGGDVDDRLEVADVGVLARALADLEDKRARFLGAGIDDRLRQLHVVDVEPADGEPAVVGEVEHRLCGHERHMTSSFPVGLR